ncbi:MAG TPA: hypothetical protein VIS48_08790 [Candidatus Kryptonia bacterium]
MPGPVCNGSGCGGPEQLDCTDARSGSYRPGINRGIRRISRLLLLSLAALGGIYSVDAARAQTLSGRFVTTFYSYQQYDTTGASKLSLRGFEALQLNFGQGNYQLHTYLLGTTDFITSQPGDPRLRAGNLYIEGRNIGDFLTLKLGRQPTFQRVGVSSFDGLSADAKFLDNKITVSAFGGALPPTDENFNLNSSPKDNLLYGAQAYYSPFDNFRVGGAYVDRNFKPDSYWAVRRDTLNAPDDSRLVYIDPTSVASEFVSGDMFYYNQQVSGYLRLDYDLNFDEFNRTEASFRYSPTISVSANVEYFHRDSRLPFNSIFSVFDHSGTDEYDAGLTYMFTRDMSAFGSISKIFYAGDNSTQFTIGTNIYLFSLNFSHNDGFAGQLNGLSAQLIYPLLDRKVMLIGSASATDYKILQSLSSTNRLYTGELGISYRPFNLLSLDVQGQYLQDPVYKNDFRGYLRANYYFFDNLGAR